MSFFRGLLILKRSGSLRTKRTRQDARNPKSGSNLSN